jgi:hypothetical protein
MLIEGFSGLLSVPHVIFPLISTVLNAQFSSHENGNGCFKAWQLTNPFIHSSILLVRFLAVVINT